MAAFFNSGTMKIGLTIKSIVRWEQLRTIAKSKNSRPKNKMCH